MEKNQRPKIQDTLMGEFYKEFLNLKIIEEENGFISYTILGKNCHIEDLFVVKEHRRSKIAWELAEKVQEIAKECKCEKLCAYSEKVFPGHTEAEKAFTAFGLEKVGESGSHIYFEKLI